MPTLDEAVAIVHQHFDGTREVNVTEPHSLRMNDAFASASNLKDVLADSREVITVKGVDTGKGQYGDTYILSVVRADGSDATVTFGAKTTSGRRENKIAAISEHLDNGGGPVGIRVTSYKTQYGSTGYDLELA